MLKIGSLCNEAKFLDNKLVGDPTEGSLIVSAEKANLNKNTLEKENPRIDELEFDPERKMMSTLNKVSSKKLRQIRNSCCVRRCN